MLNFCTMEKLLLIILVSLCFSGGNNRPIGKREDYTEDDDELTCPNDSWLDVPGFLQDTIDRMMFSENEVDVQFQFFSHRNKQEPQFMNNGNFSSWNMEASDFDPTTKIIFIIHGFKDNNAPWITRMKDALILRERCNVFVVDCGQATAPYRQVLKNMPDVGKQVAVFIRNIMKSTGVGLEKVHIIGHSAGAQSAAFAGKEIKKMAKRPVGRITGLDPAGPGFYDAGPDKRLDSTDAAFVDVIHTNFACHRMTGVGYPGAIGHFDFIANGGRQQPGCLTFSQNLGRMDMEGAKGFLKYLFGSSTPEEREAMQNADCSHMRAHQFYTSSILTDDCEFISVQCSSWNSYLSGQCNGNDKVVMGYYADKYKSLAEDGVNKKFYLNTTAKAPYCM